MPITPPYVVEDIEAVVSLWARSLPELAGVEVLTSRRLTGPPPGPWVLIERIGGAQPPVAAEDGRALLDTPDVQLACYGGKKAKAWQIANDLWRLIPVIRTLGLDHLGGRIILAEGRSKRYLPDDSIDPPRPRVIVEVTINTKPGT